jgi:hypothetical protein
MDVWNGVTRQRLSQQWEQAARPDALAGGIPQEAKALGNTRDRLTWGRCTRGHGYRRSLSLMAGAWSNMPHVLKTGRVSNSNCACVELRGRAIPPKGVPMTKARVLKS